MDWGDMMNLPIEDRIGLLDEAEKVLREMRETMKPTKKFELFSKMANRACELDEWVGFVEVKYWGRNADIILHTVYIECGGLDVNGNNRKIMRELFSNCDSYSIETIGGENPYTEIDFVFRGVIE